MPVTNRRLKIISYGVGLNRRLLLQAAHQYMPLRGLLLANDATNLSVYHKETAATYYGSCLPYVQLENCFPHGRRKGKTA
jgi:hypothetical protein